MLKQTLVAAALFIPMLGLAATSTPTAPSVPTLGSALNLTKASQCSKILKACQDSKKGPLSDNVCVQQKVKANSSCAQLQVLADKLETTPDLLDVTAAPNGFAIARKNYPADGQFQNFIVSPKGLIVDTRVDPRQYSSILKMQYPNKDLLITNIDPVQAKTTIDKHTTFVTTLKVSDGCLACSVLGYATTRFNFKKDGSLQTIRLMSFNKQENTQLAH